jgi:hypothetical protein
MKKILLIFCFLFIAARGFSQQFSLYNTGTLFDSFENPSQRTFVPDTSRKYASNFLVPNFDGNFFIKGNAQASLVSRAFGSKYNNAALQIGNGNLNYVGENASVYVLMAKMFVSLEGEEELGIYAEMKSEGHGAFTDESVALFNGPSAFSNNIYDNIFNNHFSNQIYNTVGFTYREKLSSQVAFGIKLGLLMGIDYASLDTYESHISFDRLNDAATISLRGRYRFSNGPGNFDSRSFLPTTRSPGAQVSIGTSYKTDDNITFQANIKDLGFIHWYNASTVSNFNNTTTISGISSNKRESNIYNGVHNLFTSNPATTSFTTYTDGRLELSATKSYYLNEHLKYSPTLVASKELMYNGFAGAMVNRFQYLNYYVSLLGSYDNYNLFNLGLQLMYKTHNGEIFLGSDRLIQTVSFAGATGNSGAYSNSSFTGGDIYLGFAWKFGPVIEHPLNASTIPTGEKGFIGRLWNRLFKTYR